LLGPAADDETLRSVFPWGGRGVSAAPFSDLRMTDGNAGDVGKGGKWLKAGRKYLFNICQPSEARLARALLEH
jgi:hypothetical protein